MFDFKYAEFIVPAFAITILVFAAMIGFSLNHARRWKKRYEELSGK
jgi:heme exporter protein CcmD